MGGSPFAGTSRTWVGWRREEGKRKEIKEKGEKREKGERKEKGKREKKERKKMEGLGFSSFEIPIYNVFDFSKKFRFSSF